MSTKTNKPTDHENSVGEILSKSETFIETYQKPLLIGIGVVILLFAGYWFYRHKHLLPKEQEAEVALFKGETYFGANDWDQALSGDGKGYIGFERIIDEYGSTKSGKLAKAYAGICYFHKGQPDKALDCLKSFDASDDIVSPIITCLIGDCYVELGKTEEGIKHFEKAASKIDDNVMSPMFLKKAGIAYESLNKYQQAVDAYTKIKEQYPGSNESMEIDKYIEMARAHIK